MDVSRTRDARRASERASRARVRLEKVVPECDAQRAAIRRLDAVARALDARPRLGVRDARSEASLASPGARTGGGGVEGENARGRTLERAVEALAPAATAIETEGERVDGAWTRMWMTCDGLVFVTSVSEGVGGGGDAARGTAAASGTGRDRATQRPEIPRVLDASSREVANAVRVLEGTMALEHADEMAACVERFGAGEVFVVAERGASEADGTRGAKIREAIVTLTGIDEKNVFCVRGSAEEGLTPTSDADAKTTGGWFSSSPRMKSDAAREFKERLEDWRLRWSEARVKKYCNAEFEDACRTAEFWGMFVGVDDDESKTKTEETSRDAAAETSGKDDNSIARAHESAALTAMHKYLKTAIEGAPLLGVPGAPEMALNHFQKFPEPERAPLMNAVYSHNVIQYAAAVMFAWFTPGPMGAHAAHFTNRFRICLFFACLSGNSPIDPDVIAVAIGLAAGVDKENLDLSPVIRFIEDDAADSSDDEAVEVPPERTMDIDGDVASADASTDDSSVSLASVSALMQDGLDRAIAEGGDIKRRASKMLVDFLNSGNRIALRCRRRAMKVACAAKSDALRLKMSYDDAESLARDVFRRTFTADVTKSLTKLIFGPSFLTAVQIDLTQAINASFTTFIAVSSIDIFLPMVQEHEEKLREKRAQEAAAALAALTIKNGYIRVTLRVDDDDVVRCELAPTPLPTMVEKLMNAPKMIGEKTAELTASTAVAVSSGAEVVTNWASRTTDSVRTETNRGLEIVQENAKAVSTWASRTTDSVRKETERGIERAQENAKASLETAKSGLETVGAFLDRTKSTLNEAVVSGATSVASAFSAVKTNNSGVSIDVRALPVERVAAAFESEEIDRVICESNLLFKMPIDLVLSKELKDVYAELRDDASAFIKYKDDETVLRAVQRLLELVVESGDEAAINDLIKFGVLPRPKSSAQIKLEAWREQFRRRETAAAPAAATDVDEPKKDTASAKFIPDVLPSPSDLAARLSSRLSALSFAPPASFALFRRADDPPPGDVNPEPASSTPAS